MRQVLHVPEAVRRARLNSRFVEGVQYLGELGKIFALCLRPFELGDAVELLEPCPDTLFCIRPLDSYELSLKAHLSECLMSRNFKVLFRFNYIQ